MVRKTKKKNPGSQAKRGGQEHFTGFKLQFLESRAILYQQHLDAGDVGSFYNKVTLDFLAKFGQEDDFAKEPEEDPPNPWDLLDDEKDLETEGLTEDEAASRTQRYDKLRKVC